MADIFNLPVNGSDVFSVDDEGNVEHAGSMTGKLADLILRAATELTIASGAITLTQGLHTVDTESDGASDDLTDIAGLAAGELVVLYPASAARTVVVKHAIGSGKIACTNGQDITLAEATDYVVLVGNGTQAIVLSSNVLAGQPLVADTLAEKTAAAGVTVDGCLIKDGRAAALATAAFFLSGELTGSGVSQDTAHGFASEPTLVFVIPSDITGGAFTVAYGAHDATNTKTTVTNGEKYRVVAFK